MTALPDPGALCGNVAGPLEVWTGTAALGALEFLGYTVNGATIEEQPFTAPIPSDDYGGDAGPPSGYQLFGTQHRISLEMIKYSPTVMAKLENFYNLVALATASGTAAVGMLINCTPLTTRVLLCARTATAVFTYTRNYAINITGSSGPQIIDPIEYSPIGTQVTRARLSFIINAKSGVTPWDSTTTV